MLMVGGNAFAVSVSPGGLANSTGIITDLGLFSAGTYKITGSGVVDLTGDGKFPMNPDGTPAPKVTHPSYNYFNPDGSFTADGNYGAAGNNAKIGALIGTLLSNPTNYNDWFLIGSSTTITLTQAGHIYASVNDTYHINNTGAFEATVTATPVPAAVWLLGSGLVGLVGLKRKRAKK
ncbi:MAG: VPLPA-CTERM sorting domain-containing protein [Desulfamplus sp.]|nr:VPLPA-CTERM sorting domain-containing protein [Desulfamplus sp.]